MRIASRPVRTAVAGHREPSALASANHGDDLVAGLGAGFRRHSSRHSTASRTAGSGRLRTRRVRHLHRRLLVQRTVRVAPPLGGRRAGVPRDVAVRLLVLGCRVGRRRPLRARRRRPDHRSAAGAVRVAARSHGATRRPRHVGADVVVLDRLPDAHAAAGAADVPRPGHGDVVRLRPDVPPAGLVPVHRSPTPVADLVRPRPGPRIGPATRRRGVDRDVHQPEHASARWPPSASSRRSGRCSSPAASGCASPSACARASTSWSP